jgi:hypothetical protein
MAIVLAGCGSSSSSSSNNNTGPLTGLTKRVLVSNEATSGVIIVDAKHDALSSKTMGATGAAKMVTAHGFTVVQGTGAPTITMINNSLEAVSATGSLQDVPTDVAISADGTTAWGAVRSKGVVEAFDTTTGNIKGTATVLDATRLVMSPNGTKLLVFSDDDPNTFAVIDTASFNPVTFTATGLDHPYTGVFNGSDTKAFILSCGAECGTFPGSPPATRPGAGVMEVDFSSVSFTPPPATQPVTLTPVAGPTAPGAITGATVGLLSGSTLFVAGTPPGTGKATGTLQMVDAGTFAVTNAGSGVIPDGLHQVMAMTSNKRLYVGSNECTVTSAGSNLVFGCLAVFDTSANTDPFIPPESSLRQDFNVTGLQPISNRNVIYVIQGGELDIFDITTNLPSTSITQLDLIGNAVGIVQIDP